MPVFSADVAALRERGTSAETALYVAASVALSIIGLFLGLLPVRRVAGEEERPTRSGADLGAPRREDEGGRWT